MYTNWQPIKTAPKDGTIIRLRDEKRIHSSVMAWNKKRKQWEGMAYSMIGSAKTYWDESFVRVYEWRDVNGHSN